MKGNKTDDLFRNGLGSHKITPPSTAWDKIESQLPKKSKKGIYFWMSVAASILIILSFGWVIINKNNSEIGVDSKERQAGIKPAIIEEPTLKQADEPSVDKAAPASPTQLVTKSLPSNLKPKNDLPKKEQKSAIVPAQTALDNNLQASVEVEEATENKELIRIDRLTIDFNTQQSFIANNTFKLSPINDTEVNLSSYINSYEIMTMQSSKRKRLSLLSGIVNVAKGVNNSKIALSEMRKSKNDFFNNDLKYGTKEAEAEDIDQDLDEN
ncbi:hypothetical protein [Roseivirga misakiensis]|uniref:Uncharacterized protein n=1 Tax=Roseivirga misakiensis TaxID=1563681 RepID=A0A1E5SK36_9BACT|nr:hypothetical protein [Roseivirga misakiensis]OEJ99471.1 hypothetical protein BFP71_07745 [Roseivirga misakiensis]